jgi:hypothetical protein
MGTWGPGIWSDDTAADVRASYREALEDGLGDDEAAALVLTEFAAELGDEDTAGVVWLALAVSQHLAGRLSAQVRDQALSVIDSGADARRWEHAEPRARARRAEVLAKVQDQLAGPQPARKRIRRPPRQVTSLTPGDILAYQAPSGRIHLLAVRAVAEDRYGAFPIVHLLDYHQQGIPLARELAELQDQRAGRGAHQAQPPDPWWAVAGQVMHKRRHDFADHGFEVIGHVPAPSQEEQETLKMPLRSYASWSFWQAYLDAQDKLLGNRPAISGTNDSAG